MPALQTNAVQSFARITVARRASRSRLTRLRNACSGPAQSVVVQGERGVARERRSIESCLEEAQRLHHDFPSTRGTNGRDHSLAILPGENGHGGMWRLSREISLGGDWPINLRLHVLLKAPPSSSTLLGSRMWPSCHTTPHSDTPALQLQSVLSRTPLNRDTRVERTIGQKSFRRFAR